MFATVARSTTVVLSTLILTALVLVGLPSTASAAGSIVFTAGPGTGAPPTQLGIVNVTRFPADTRPLGGSVNTIGPLNLSKPAVHHRVGRGWATWSHGYKGDVYQTSGLKISLPLRTSAFYFYAEPNRFATITIVATTDNGTTSKSIAVNGEGGARFFGFYSKKPLTDHITSVSISSSEVFAVGEFGIRSGLGTYVAMGDSFSSGEGTGSYNKITDTAGNRCHRGGNAYGPLLSASDKSLRPIGFVACSGSVTYDLTHANHSFTSEAPQIDALSPLTKQVTVTIGGNDVGFADVLKACIKAKGNYNGRGCSRKAKTIGPVDARIGALGGKAATTAPGGYTITPLKKVLASIHAKAPNAKIYIAGYPELFGSKKKHFSKDKSSPSGYICKVNTVAAASLDFDDAQWMNKKTKALNAAISKAVKSAKASDKTLKASYVKPSKFDGHGLCDSSSRWINKLTLDAEASLAPRPESFHPNLAGQRKGYKKAFEKAGI